MEGREGKDSYFLIGGDDGSRSGHRGGSVVSFRGHTGGARGVEGRGRGL
jgi:hypothetical protein